VLRPKTAKIGALNQLLARHPVKDELEDEEVINLGPRTYAVSNQWGSDNIEPFLERARSLGFDINAVAAN